MSMGSFSMGSGNMGGGINWLVEIVWKWTKRVIPSVFYTKRSKPVDIYRWSDMTMIWVNATKRWQDYKDKFITRSGLTTGWTKRVQP